MSIMLMGNIPIKHGNLTVCLCVFVCERERVCYIVLIHSDIS